MNNTINTFEALYEAVIIENFDNKNQDKLQFKTPVKLSEGFKKAVKTGNAPKKANGLKFTPKKQHFKGNVIHFTNNKNAFKRSQLKKAYRRS